MAVWTYTPTTSTFYAVLNATFYPGDIVDFGAGTAPADPTTNNNPTGNVTPLNTAKWSAGGTANTTIAARQLPALGSIYVLRNPGTGAAPAAAAGANAGTSPPVPVVDSGSTDTRGGLTFGTGTTPAAGAEVGVTLTAAAQANPIVVLTARNTATQALGLYVSAVTTAGFTISCTTAPAASQANTIYSVGYVVVS